MIPYSRQDIDQKDIDAVLEVLKSDYLTQGPKTPLFEESLCRKFLCKHAVAVNNATSALHLACLALEVSKGDIVWTSTITFVASANCARYCGAEVDLVDIDETSFNMSVSQLEQKLKIAKSKNKLPKVVIPVHLAGNPCDMEGIYRLSKEYGFKIIEDASHATGAVYKKSKIGSCKFSDITVFSFHPVKMITTAEGGVCLTNNETLFNKIYNLRSHGIIRSNYTNPDQSHGPWYYEQTDLGYNYRLNDLLSALGNSQISRLDSFVEKRNTLARYYNEKFKEHEFITTQNIELDNLSSYHLFIIKISKNHSESRLTLFEKLRSEGYFVNIHYIPIYKHPYYSKMFDQKEFPNSEDYYSNCISLPLYPGLEKSEIDNIIDILSTEQGYQTIF
jgi:UDP-4-amino-4,6-dideoxy-N-acetyl-beta-L-altrosamine transaminase